MSSSITVTGLEVLAGYPECSAVVLVETANVEVDASPAVVESSVASVGGEVVS